MLTIDSINTLAFSAEDVCAMDASQVSSPAAFKRFADGIELKPDFLLSDRWDGPDFRFTRDIANLIIQEMLPEVYSFSHLMSIGGSFALRVTEMADYTITAVNRRVVVFSGLPIDHETGDEIIDLEIAYDVLLAFCRGAILDLSDSFLEEDDEAEDRILTSAELNLVGISGGQSREDHKNAWIGQMLGAGRFRSPQEAGAAWEHHHGSQYDNRAISVCGANQSQGVCYQNISACGANASVSAGINNVSACGANASSSLAAGNLSACGGNVSVGLCAGNSSVCGGNASGCGANAVNVGACGTKISGCGANAGLATCGAKVGGCGLNTGASACGLNVGACGANLGGVCGANLGLGDPISICAVNILPLLPSC